MSVEKLYPVKYNGKLWYENEAKNKDKIKEYYRRYREKKKEEKINSIIDGLS